MGIHNFNIDLSVKKNANLPNQTQAISTSIVITRVKHSSHAEHQFTEASAHASRCVRLCIQRTDGCLPLSLRRASLLYIFQWWWSFGTKAQQCIFLLVGLILGKCIYSNQRRVGIPIDPRLGQPTKRWGDEMLEQFTNLHYHSMMKAFASCPSIGALQSCIPMVWRIESPSLKFQWCRFEESNQELLSESGVAFLSFGLSFESRGDGDEEHEQFQEPRNL